MRLHEEPVQDPSRVVVEGLLEAAPTQGARHWSTGIPALVGYGYVIAWIAGLSTWPSNLGLDSSDLAVAHNYRIHAGQATAQYLLVEGLAGLLLGTIAVLLGRAAGTPRRSFLVRTSVTAGLAASLVSVTQSVLGFAIVANAKQHDVARAGDLFDLVNRLDGIKMLLIAVTATCFLATPRSGRPLPRWLRMTSGALAVSITASGVSYLCLESSFAWLVYISGPLLLAWVTGVGLWISRVNSLQAGQGTSDAAVVAR